MVIAIIGSRRYNNIIQVRETMDCILRDKNIWSFVISGKCPKKNSVDNWAIDYAQDLGYHTMEFPPKFNTKEYFFDRNKYMAEVADFILAFIPRNQIRSGAWNTISELRKLNSDHKFYMVIDEEGKMWDRLWVKKTKPIKEDVKQIGGSIQTSLEAM